jgi:hypothetical protein
MAKKPSPVLAFSFLALFSGFSGWARGEEIDKKFHQSFTVKEGDSLCLRCGDGHVTVVPWDKDVIDVNVRYRADIDVAGIRIGGRRDFDVEFRQTSRTVYVTAKEPSGGAIGFYNKKVYEYVYEIHSPAFIRLDLEGDDGDIMVENWAADIECRVDDGDVRLRNIAGGRTDIRTDDGDVTIEGLGGNLTIALDDGDVKLSGCDLESCRLEGDDGEIRVRESKGSFDIITDDGHVIMERLEARGLHIATDGGDIDVDLLAGPARLAAELETDDGDIEIALEKGFSVSFQVSADDADSIRLHLTNVEGYKEDKHGKSGSINGGTGRLRVRTADGDVTIRDKT